MTANECATTYGQAYTVPCLSEQEGAVTTRPTVPSQQHRWVFPSRALRCEVRLVEEQEGGFSVYAALLPGVVSQADTYEDAVANITEALAGAIEEYESSGTPVPWLAEPEAPKPEERRCWVTVDV